ncbi:MAG: gamma-glutamyltransferase [Chloroflexi bacterium]|nr:gamma-glutamyltransferase [Chloroflexota bacterium]MCL5074074.1 gamma-glutamyltransferase [Chloroflexota bacterium]
MAPLSTYRPVITSRRAMAVSDHHLATQTAIDILRKGGNAMDAAIAAAAVLAVVKPYACGLGGDLFLLFYGARGGRVLALNASGRAPSGADRQWFWERGYKDIPSTSVHSVTVPGVVDGWVTALSRFGTMSLAEVLRPAITYALEGFPVSVHLHQQLCSEWFRTRASPALWTLLWPNGRPPESGDVLVQANLGRSLSEIAAGGRSVFYNGEITAALVGSLQKWGGSHTLQDFAEHSSTWMEPISTTYRGYQIYEMPPNSQGIALLLQLNLVEDIPLEDLGHNAPGYIHLLVEAVKLSFADRDKYIGDPDFMDIPVALLLSKEYAARRRNEIDPAWAAAQVAPGQLRGGEDTVYLAVVDEEGSAVSLIQSIFDNFGSGLADEKTGIILHNRGSSFNLTGGHVNCIQPRKRPYHTLNPAMGFKDGHLFLVFGTPGADGQTQTLLQVLNNIVVFGMDIQQAVEAPRWRLYPENRLGLESRLAAVVGRRLEDQGHHIFLMADWDFDLGSAQGIIIDRKKGVLFGGADPRREAYAIGL